MDTIIGLYIIRCKLSVSTDAVEFVRKITKNVQYTQVFRQKTLVNVFFFVIYQQIWSFFPSTEGVYMQYFNVFSVYIDINKERDIDKY